MTKVIYDNEEYVLYESSKYPGKCIISKEEFPAGSKIYWNTTLKKGFLADNYKNNMQIINTIPGKGPNDKNKTYDDSESRNFVKEILKKKCNLTLEDHPDLYDKEGRLIHKGQYLIDLISYDFMPDKILFVEVERYFTDDIFEEDNTNDVNILASKYHRYIGVENPREKYIICYVNSTNTKCALIFGTDIKNAIDIKFDSFYDKNNICRHVFKIPKKYVEILNKDY